MSANPAIEGRSVNVPLIAAGAIVVIVSFVAVVVIGQLTSRPSAASTATQPVLVAARDIAPRTILVAEDLTVAHYAGADVPPAAFGKASEAMGQIAQTSFKKGQPVLSNQVGKDAGSGVVAGYLPLAPGIVALTVPSAEVAGVAGSVQAGNYINIEAVVTPRGSPTANVRTIYGNVRVIRVGPASVTAGGTAAGTQQTGGLTSSLTLALTECQAEYINWFLANASLKYTLLAYQDYQTTLAPDTTCPKAGSSAGITEGDIKSHWPGLD
jgi:Flp pilus assembly protein CpaB